MEEEFDNLFADAPAEIKEKIAEEDCYDDKMDEGDEHLVLDEYHSDDDKRKREDDTSDDNEDEEEHVTKVCNLIQTCNI